MNKSEEIIYSDFQKVSCAGENQIIGHPKVYLEIPSDSDYVVCPYCSKKFIHKNK